MHYHTDCEMQLGDVFFFFFAPKETNLNQRYSPLQSEGQRHIADILEENVQFENEKNYSFIFSVDILMLTGVQ